MAVSLAEAGTDAEIRVDSEVVGVVTDGAVVAAGPDLVVGMVEGMDDIANQSEVERKMAAAGSLS